MRRRNMRSKQSLQEFMGRLTGRQHPTRAWRQPSDGFCRHRSKSLNLQPYPQFLWIRLWNCRRKPLADRGDRESVAAQVSKSS